MTAERFVYTVLHCGKDFYYLPTQETWTVDVKRISLGDVYFTGTLVKAYLGKNPEPPNMADYSGLSSNPDKKKIVITLG